MLVAPCVELVAGVDEPDEGVRVRVGVEIMGRVERVGIIFVVGVAVELACAFEGDEI